jgi:hypothetical protein
MTQRKGKKSRNQIILFWHAEALSSQIIGIIILPNGPFSDTFAAYYHTKSSDPMMYCSIGTETISASAQSMLGVKNDAR